MENLMHIKATLFSLCVLLTACATQTPETVEMQPGLWETRLSKMAWDGKDMLKQIEASVNEAQKERLAQLTPEQRQQIDGVWARRICVNAAMTKAEYWLALPKFGCAPAKVRRDGQRVTVETTCQPKPGARAISEEDDWVGFETKFRAEMVIANPANAEIISTSAANDGSPRLFTQETQMKFLGSDCGDLRPEDEEPHH
jgi:hypothetical protein